MAESSEIRRAIVSDLLNDGTLMALMTNGVYLDVSAKGATKFVIVSLVEGGVDGYDFQGRVFETPLYLVKAVALGSSGADADAAAERIDVVLDHTLLTLASPSTYADIESVREGGRIEITEVDDSDQSIRWQHRGGHYRIHAAVA